MQSTRTPGRKRAQLSRELILHTALVMLEEAPLEDFTLGKLARRLNAGVMSLYTYFPSRDDLLNAVAEQFFQQLALPASDASGWQDAIRERLWATHRLLTEYPLVLLLVFREKKHSPLWIREWWLPIARLLKAQGLSTEATTFAMNWFTSTAMGLLTSQLEVTRRWENTGFGFIETLAPEQRLEAVELWQGIGSLDLQAVLEFGFNQLISGLETLVHTHSAQ